MIDDPSEYLDKNKWRSFKEWSDGGYLIVKGSKGTKVNGVYLFSREQVMKSNVKSCIDDPFEENDINVLDTDLWDPWDE